MLEVGTVNILEQPGYQIKMTVFGCIKESENDVKERILAGMKFLLISKSICYRDPRQSISGLLRRAVKGGQCK